MEEPRRCRFSKSFCIVKTELIQRAILIEVDGITDPVAGTAKRDGITFYA
jgi:hypothetical protein